ncbi:hypothetical protein BC332_34291 [Capsicum chinense]|nr:hypothetical protein BC332_34291 [Capsicum chinense]
MGNLKLSCLDSGETDKDSLWNPDSLPKRKRPKLGQPILSPVEKIQRQLHNNLQAPDFEDISTGETDKDSLWNPDSVPKRKRPKLGQPILSPVERIQRQLHINLQAPDFEDISTGEETVTLIYARNQYIPPNKIGLRAICEFSTEHELNKKHYHLPLELADIEHSVVVNGGTKSIAPRTISLGDKMGCPSTALFLLGILSGFQRGSLSVFPPKKCPQKKRSELGQPILSPVERIQRQLHNNLQAPDFEDISTGDGTVTLIYARNQCIPPNENGLGAMLFIPSHQLLQNARCRLFPMAVLLQRTSYIQGHLLSVDIHLKLLHA